MPKFTPIRSSFLIVVVSLSFLSFVCTAQEPASPPSNSESKPAELSQPAEAPETPAPPAPAPLADGIVDKPSDWATGPKEDFFHTYVPASTDFYASPEEAKAHLGLAVEAAFRDHVRKKAPKHVAYVVTPPAWKINEKYAWDNVWEVLREKDGDKYKYRATKRLDIMNAEVDFLISEYYRKREQFSAVGKTLFLGGGLLGFVAILAASARLNHATSGKRSGILRAASMIAILSLLGGLMTAGVLGRVFTS